MVKEILIVDDEKEDLDALKKILEKEKYIVKTSKNGAEALDILRGNNFNLVIIDIRMPTFSGYDLLRLIRKRLNHNTKMIYCTIVPKQDVDLADIDGFIQKPFSPKTVLTEVKKVFT